MSKIKIFLMLSGYQLTWLMCIFGELWYSSFSPGLVCGLLFLAICFVNSDNIKKTIQIVFLISLIGYLFDTSLVFFEIYNFQTSLYIGVLPIWMLVLWPSFAILFDEILIFLSKYKIIAVILSGILGPLTYYAGSPLGLININNLFLFFIFMILFWAILMIFYLNYIIKLKFK
ncbi:DUF2878 domain-containing protein [Alphaproteobacteria bacterium]|jgi:hypothetical protein|nr:DUF2878 domain-containing protein [Alphaproteobacteria bacterium]MDC3270442.1 DUF2878 domain-containing protein [Alphaproteobacteria bacterium]